MYLKILISFLLFISTAQAKTTVVSLGSPKKARAFQLYLSQFGHKKSLMEALISKRIAETDKLVEDKFILATKGIVMADLKPSIYLYKELAGLKKSSLFSGKTRDYIAESYYRLASLESSKNDFWVREGLTFNLKFEPSTTIFNPKIISSYNKQLNSIKNYSLILTRDSLINLQTKLFINGSDPGDQFKVYPSTTYTVRALQNGHSEFNQDLTGEEIARLKKITFEALDFGTCKNPKFITYEGISIDEIFFSPNCIKHRKNQAKPLQQIAKRPDFVKKEPSLDLSSPEQPLKKKGLFQKRSTWYVIAGALVTSAIIIAMNNNSSKDVNVTPVHR